MAAIYSNGGNRWNILGFNFTKRDALSSVYKISMYLPHIFTAHNFANSYETFEVVWGVLCEFTDNCYT
jgi:hypothetical protein